MIKIENKKYLRAKRKVENLKSFYIHLIVFILVNTLLILINVLNYKEVGNWWFIYPVIGWGIGLAIHGISITSFSFFGEKWEGKKIEKYINEDKRDN